MPICHGYHGLFAACGGSSGVAGSRAIHQIGGMRHEVTLWHLARTKGATRTAKERETFDRQVSSARRKASALADLTPQETKILRRERDHLAFQLKNSTTLSKSDRTRMKAEAMLITRQLKRSDRAAALRQQKTDLLKIQADHYAQQAATRHGAERQVSQHYADKAASELEAYQRREAVHYVHYGDGTKDTLRSLFGHDPPRAEIATALGVKPGSDITLARRGGYLHAVVHDPGWSPFVRRPDLGAHTYDLFRDISGKLRSHTLT